jgi:hypothetical protein
MTTLNLQIPDAVLAKLRDLAARENVSVDEFAAATLAERAQAASQLEYLQQRAARGSREKFLRAMSKVPNVPPILPDEAPPR